jgi:hypothetical protein
VSALARFQAWLAALPAPAARALAADFAARARQGGAFVVRPDGREVAIPPILTPTVLTAPRLAEVSRDAHLLLRGVVKATTFLMTTPEAAPLKERLFGELGPLEALGLARTWEAARHLATARVDFLVDELGRHRALEVNATIPAMQGYADAVAEAFLHAVAQARGRDAAEVAALVEANGRNADDLLASLLSQYHRLGGRDGGPLRIAVMARAGDAQRGELERYVARWRELGHAVWLVTPHDAREGWRAGPLGGPPDLVYRHVFARRLDPDGDFARLLLEPERHRIFNPMASHLEVKGVLGLLSAPPEGLLLDDDEADAVRRALPWTRILQPGPTRGPGGEAVSDLAAFTAAEGHSLVLKRSWDYGGKTVFVGADVSDQATQARLAELIGRPGPLGWADLLAHALSDRGAWVVQELVRVPREERFRSEDGAPVARALYADLSAFTATDAPLPRGGAVRASESRIVNILGGGGMSPLLREDVLARLF